MDAHQTPVYYEDILDALADLVRANGGTKKLGAFLWPHKPMAEAHTRLANCIDRNRPEKLDPHELTALFKLSRDNGYHPPFIWFVEDCGYQKTAPRDPRVEEDKLATAISDASKTLGQLIKQAEALQSRKALAAVK